MNYRFLLVFLLCLGACNTESNKTSNSDEPSLDWILGDWQRINEVEGKRTYEFWKKSGKEYNGLGYTLRDIDTIFMEKLKIHKIEDKWTLEVSGPNEDPTIFIFRAMSENKFIADCPTNDFPKTISYYALDENLHAIISDSAMSIPFEFSPLVEL